MNITIIDNVTAVLPQGLQTPCSLKLVNGIIEELCLRADAPTSWFTHDSIRHHRFSPDMVVLPGFIDTHIHGIHHADVMDATPEALITLCRQLPATGTTAFLATTLSAPVPDITQALLNLSLYTPSAAHAEIIGIHLEGPFISADFHGAHPKEHIIPADPILIDLWQQHSAQRIKLITLAPETLSPDMAFIRYLCQHGIVPAIGHSGATASQTASAIDAGAAHITHLFNAMGCKYHRQPGLTTDDLFSDGHSPGIAQQALRDPRVKVELIVDNVHLHPQTVRSVFQHKSADGIILITDAMRATCCGEGKFHLGGQAVTVDQHAARLADGTLAGSVLTMAEAIFNMLQITGCSWMDIAKMTAENPAKQCSVFDRKGSIAVGKDADLIFFNQTRQLQMTLCRGEIAYQA